MTQIHSDWNELRELSEQQRNGEILDNYNILREAMEMLVWEWLTHTDADFKDYLHTAQQHLDRIKALVMSRSCNQEK